MTENFSWVFCPECGHKVYRKSGGGMDIEIPCSSCKAIVVFLATGATRIIKEPKHPLAKRL